MVAWELQQVQLWTQGGLAFTETLELCRLLPLTDAFQKLPRVTSHSLLGNTCPGGQSCAGCWEKAAGGKDTKTVIFFFSKFQEEFAVSWGQGMTSPLGYCAQRAVGHQQGEPTLYQGALKDFSKNQGGPGREESSGKGTRVSVVCKHVDSVTVLTQGAGGSGETPWDLGLALVASTQHEISGKCLPEDAFYLFIF